MRRGLNILLLVVTACLFTPAAASATPVMLMIQVHPQTSQTERTQILQDAGVIPTGHVPFMPNTLTGSIDQSKANQALKTVQDEPGVIWAEQNEKLTVKPASNDPMFSGQWYYQNPIHPGMDINLGSSWDLSTGKGVRVGVVDGLMDTNHPDLAGRIPANTNPGDIPGNGIDDDHNGLVDDTQGWNFNYNNSNVTTVDPVESHATGVAGVIAADKDNGIGPAGIAPDASIIPLVNYSPGYTMDAYRIATIFSYAGELGLDFVNVSEDAGGWYYDVVQQAIHDHPNTLYVVAAGNDYSYLTSDTSQVTHNFDGHPRAVQGLCSVALFEENLLCVGAAGSSMQSGDAKCYSYLDFTNDCMATYSNYSNTDGPVQIYAPGQQLTTLTPDGGYTTKFGGTSGAAPVVVGAGALLKQLHPNWTAVQIKTQLIRTADKNLTNWHVSADSPDYKLPRLNIAHALGGPDDFDHDGLLDSNDNCPNDYNMGQADRDHDGIGDVCDPLPDGADPDNDKLGAQIDNCPNAYNPDQSNIDGKGPGDACDPKIYTSWCNCHWLRRHTDGWHGEWSYFVATPSTVTVWLQHKVRRRWRTTHTYKVNLVPDFTVHANLSFRLAHGRRVPWRIITQAVTSFGKSAKTYSSIIIMRY